MMSSEEWETPSRWINFLLLIDFVELKVPHCFLFGGGSVLSLKIIAKRTPMMRA